MSLPCVEVAVAPANEAFLANPKDKSLVQPALDLLKSSKGLIKIYYGQESEDPRRSTYTTVIWEELQDHRNLQADPVQYPILGKHTQHVIHIQPLAEPYKALEAPATELAYMKVIPGVSKEILENQLDGLVKAVNGLPESHGAISAVWGPTVEDDDTLELDTARQAHWNAVKTVPDLIQRLKDIREIATIGLTHQLLAPYN
ncbi:uncharacterized protein B0H18DRAFT_979310 [Fomitopsis serialis]|uniref:uncharacterized protein n=1 Tax=Fomitopsis serialis TaxID=139415 RepID=UPI002008C820|nr:uncharacterized protein B0H18DRAFT_979310 [Neoantrodia serialis]KAH9934989.1 hypothetical protein B0H18DRAFT_979310 [Neoantrodia serialis]